MGDNNAGQSVALRPARDQREWRVLRQLAIGVLGVLVITTEYGTGMIRTSLAAVPQRGNLLTAKAVVLFAVTLVVGITASFVSFFTTQTILSANASTDLGVSITDPGALQTVFGAGLFLALMGLLGCGVGGLLRRSAGAITTLFGLTLLVPVRIQLLPAAIKNNVTKYLPSEAGSAIYRQIQQPHVLTPAAGLLVLCSYAVLPSARQPWCSGTVTHNGVGVTTPNSRNQALYLDAGQRCPRKSRTGDGASLHR